MQQSEGSRLSCVRFPEPSCSWGCTAGFKTWRAFHFRALCRILPRRRELDTACARFGRLGGTGNQAGNS